MELLGFGYARSDESQESPTALREITLVAEPEVLRAVARLILEAAECMEEDRAGFDHLHLQDRWAAWDESCVDVIVAAPPES